MKRLISLSLVIALLFALVGCGKTNPIDGASANPTANAGESFPVNTGSDGSSQNPSDLPTSDPTQVIKTQADLDFEALDRELFLSVIASDGLTYHQFVKDPSSFDIDESTVELGWGSYSYEDHLAYGDADEEFMARLNAINRDELSPHNQIAYDVIAECYALGGLVDEYFYCAEPLEPLNGIHTMIPLLMSTYEINDMDDIEGYLYLLEDAPRYLAQIAQFEREKAQQGLFMTENALDKVIESCRSFANEGSNCFLIEHLEDIINNASFEITAEKKSEYLDRNRDCIMNELLPAYTELADTLNSLRGSCGSFAGAMERGGAFADYYKLAIQSEAACNFSYRDIALALEAMCNQTYVNMYNEIMADPSALSHYGSPITSGDVQTDVDYLLRLIESVYPSIPDQQIQYINVPDAISGDFSPAAYLISAYDDPSRNVVLLNPESNDSNLLFTLAHECFPGHLYQTQYFRNTDGVSLSQQVISPSGYSEGWAVFSELMIAGMCEEYGTSIAKITQYESILCNILIPAYVSVMVNAYGWTPDVISEYLEEYNLDIDSYRDIIYEYAIDMPLYFFNYAMGYTYTSMIYESVAPETSEENLAFFTKYLNYGPCYFNILFEEFGIVQ